MLLDSNIIIYAAMPQYAYLHNLINSNPVHVSVISKIEVLGYNLLQKSERKLFEEFFKGITIIPLSDDIVESAIKLRSNYKLTLGDAMIAATALSFNLHLVTRNVNDFKHIKSLKLINPIK